MRKFIITLLLVIPLILPVTAFAEVYPLNFVGPHEQNTKQPQTIGDIFQGFSEGNLAGLIPTIIVAVGLVTFLAGVVGFIGAGDNEEKRSQGQKVMVFGIVVLFVMMTYWGFVGFFTKSFLGESPAIPNYLPALQRQ